MHSALNAPSNPAVASLLTLPTELRHRIYEYAYDGSFAGSKLVWQDGLVLTIYGTSAAGQPDVRAFSSPFTLLRVCHKLNDDVNPLLPSLRDIKFDLRDFTMDAAETWLSMMSHIQISMMRKIQIMGWNTCTLVSPPFPNIEGYEIWVDTLKRKPADYDRSDANVNHGLCDRHLSLDLTVFERDFDKAQWDRLLNADHRAISLGTGSYVGAPVRDREYYKGYYLLRNLDGCVRMPQPRSHSGRYTKKCSSIVDIQQSLSPIIDYDGSIRVTKEAILGVVKSVINNSSDALPLRGW